MCVHIPTTLRPVENENWRIIKVYQELTFRFHDRSFLKAIRRSDSVIHSMTSYVICAHTGGVRCTLHTFTHKDTKKLKIFFLYSRLFTISKTSIIVHEKHYKHLSNAKNNSPKYIYSSATIKFI